MNEKEGGFIVTLFKEKFSEEALQKLGLNARQIKAVLYVREKKSISNKEYQEINQISNRTATSDLKELVEKFSILKKSGAGAGISYHA